MPIIYDWDLVVLNFENMYKQVNEPGSRLYKELGDHALGMLRLIPHIREFPEFLDFELNFSRGQLMCTSKITGGRVYLVAFPRGSGFVYRIETYEQALGHSAQREVSLEELIALLPEVLKALSREP